MTITVETTIMNSIERVWMCWTTPKHITNWNFASNDWCCPRAVNDLRPGGSFNWRMEARDGSTGFDFEGRYEQVADRELIAYRIADGRAVSIRFSTSGNAVKLSETFEAENIHTVEEQRAGWQAILDRFKAYVESEAG